MSHPNGFIRKFTQLTKLPNIYMKITNWNIWTQRKLIKFTKISRKITKVLNLHTHCWAFTTHIFHDKSKSKTWWTFARFKWERRWYAYDAGNFSSNFAKRVHAMRTYHITLYYNTFISLEKLCIRHICDYTVYIFIKCSSEHTTGSLLDDTWNFCVNWKCERWYGVHYCCRNSVRLEWKAVKEKLTQRKLLVYFGRHFCSKTQREKIINGA